jgi:hypothetical protein
LTDLALITRRVCHALGRPAILQDVSINLTLLPPLQELSNFQMLYSQSQLREKIYETSSRSCPFSAELIEIIHRQLDSSIQRNTAWMTLYPLSRHTCGLCSTLERWEYQIERVSISALDHAFEQHRERRVISIWLATIEVFTGGAILADISIRRKRGPLTQDHVVPFRSWNRCTSLLSSFSVLELACRTCV